MPVSSSSSFDGLRGRVRPWMIAAPAGAVLVAAVGLVALTRVPLPGVAPIDPSDAMHISVVQPIEPEIAPGGTMEVGELVDGYVHVAAAPRSEADVYDDAYASAWLEPLPEPRTRVWRSSDVAVVTPTAPQEPQRAEPAQAGNPYGFDAPAPDYAAAREARRVRYEQMEREGWREVPVSAPRDARLSSDSTFY